eukprot:bmy_02354T0
MGSLVQTWQMRTLCRCRTLESFSSLESTRTSSFLGSHMVWKRSVQSSPQWTIAYLLQRRGKDKFWGLTYVTVATTW